MNQSQQQIRTHETPPRGAAETVPPERGSILIPSLIEREDVFATLDRLYDESLHGSSRFALIQAPLGGGKTSVLHGFLESVRQSGALVLNASASHQERTVQFSTLSQLFQTAQVPKALRDAMDILFSNMAACEGTAGPDQNVIPDPIAADLRTILGVLVDLCAEVPLVLGIDNLHHLDVASSRCLGWIFSRLQNSGPTVVMTERPGRRPVGSRLRSELLEHVPVHQIDLAPLGRGGVRSMVSGRLGETEADWHGARYADLSGGNPLILRHLIHLHSAGMQEHPSQYGFAVLSVLLRGEPGLLAVSRALAVLGPDASPRAIAAVAGMDLDLAEDAMHTLGELGILQGTAFSDPCVAAEVLADLPRQDRTVLRRRAAVRLHEQGAPAAVLAAQLVETTLADLPWARETLARAAREALAGGQPGQALAFLQHALRAQDDPVRQAALRAQISRLKWQTRPAKAAVTLPPLESDLAAGHLQPGDLADLCWMLAWYGELDMLREILDRRGRPEESRPAEAGVLRAVRAWMESMYPAWLDGAAVAAARSTPRQSAQRLDPWSSAAELADVLVQEGGGRPAGRAEGFLYAARPDHDSLWSGESALLTVLRLVYSDELDAAADWCAHLLSEARRRDTPAWTAVFTAVQAEVALRRGQPATAAAGAAEALAAIPSAGWGVAIGLPISTLVLAEVSLGRLDEAARHLARPVPEAMLHSRYGLHYLYARGQYRLAAGDPRPALADFLLCAGLTRRWAGRGTGPVPWRAGAAQGWLGLGNQEQARLLAREELSRIAPQSSRARGLALRVLADASAPAERPHLLTGAAAAMQECGDRFEHARTLFALRDAYLDVDDYVRAHRAESEALAAESGPTSWEAGSRAGTEPEGFMPDGSAMDGPIPAGAAPAVTDRRVRGGAGRRGHGGKRDPEHGDDRLVSLTARERHVAALAGQGLTNQEIAERLLITPSTVEQHLTRVFRKLGITGRAGLPGGPLHAAMPEASTS